MQYVDVHAADGDFNDYKIGRIFIKDGKIECDPPDDHTLKHIISKPVRRYPYKFDVNPLGVSANEPEVFLMSIHKAYQNAYLRIGSVEEGAE
jgi:hypothetical protein